MLKDLFSNRLFMGALAFFTLCVGGSLFYSHHEKQKGEAELAETQDRVKQWNEGQNPTTEVKAGDTSQDVRHKTPHETPAQSTPAPLREPVPVETSRAPMNASKGAGNPHPFQNIPVDLYDFEATKATMIENINFVKANWDPETFFDKDLGRELRIAYAIATNISHVTLTGFYTREQNRELRALYFPFSDMIGNAADEMLQRQGGK